MSLVGDLTGAAGVSRTGFITAALQMAGVPDRIAEAAGLAAALAEGFSGDSFDFDKVNKGAVARHVLRAAFGVPPPGSTLLLTAALNVVPRGFLGAGGPAVAATAATAGAGAAAAGSGALLAGGGTVMGALAASQLNMGGLLRGLLQPGDLAATAFGVIAGDGKADVRSALGMQRANAGVGSMFAALPKPAFFEDIIAALMVDFVKDKQDEIEGKLKDLQKRSEKGKSAGNQAGGLANSGVRAVVPGAGGVADAATDGNSDSRNIEFEMIKNEVQKMTQMQQAMSNVLNTMHEQAMNSIRQIKG